MILALVVPAQPVRFAVVSDTQGDPVNEFTFPNVIQYVLDMSPPVEFVIVTGDLVWGVNNDPDRTDRQFDHWRALTAPWFRSEMTGAKVYPVPGNHDARDPARMQAIWTRLFPGLPGNGPPNCPCTTYSFDAGLCHFVLLDTYSPGRGHRAPDLDWLAADLADSAKPVKLVFGHDPAYPFFRHIGSSLDAYPADRDAFWQVLAAQGVRAYFCGHEHHYDRWMKDGVQQITSGGLPGTLNFSQNYFIVDADDHDVTVGVYWFNGLRLASYRLSDTAGVPTDQHLGQAALQDSMPLSCVTPFLATVFLLLLGFGALWSPRWKSPF